MTLQIHDILWGIGLMSKSGESLSVQPYCQLTIIGAQNVNSKIELFPSKQQRFIDVLLDNVCLVLFCLLFSLLFLTLLLLRFLLIVLIFRYVLFY